ncbi:NAD(P)/FAD-dependent oxidoreductase [Jiella pacifica]|uniref:FAD-dependent oxidoreductase n=1 Tax=Jiella pacifica TaxID=2696469 RepID=A0A6N9TA79_9HYPH|nr:FAD-binding oxidoreductase [Jiella pacifica]NDW06609.1 FAD-dependent oxidoreductase [Jiella pacifica]
MDVIVIGGGLMGTAASFFLARRGVKVTLIERGRVGTGATVASFGNVRRTGRYLPQLPLAHRSRALWGEAERMLGRDVEFRATGHLRLVFDEKGREDMRRFIEAARPWNFEPEEIGQNELRARFPGIGPDAIGGSFAETDGNGNPRLICPAFAAAAQKLGATILEEQEVLDVARTGSGFSVTTSTGRFEAEVLLNTAGAWGAKIAARFGETVPIEARGPQMGVTEPLPYRIAPVVGMWAAGRPNGYLRQVERGNIVFGGGAVRTHVDLERTRYATADPARLPRQLASLLPLLPALADVSVIRTWSGVEGYVADDLPVMGPSATTPGLYHAFGFCGHGFQLGPGVGDVMAELIATGRTETPIADFDIARFNGASTTVTAD